MSVFLQIIESLRGAVRCAYSPAGPWAAEPTALSSIALDIHGELDASSRLADQLADAQQHDGAIGALSEHDTPAWPTSLAVLAWIACDEAKYADNIRRGIEWTLTTHGKPAEPNPQVGHDPSILGWSWAANTHAWMEPTCMFVLALRAAGLSAHSRTREGVRLITDRLLPTGGSNFGSTLVLGQATLPQVQSTGLAMLALAGEINDDLRVAASLEYLEASIGSETTTSSMCYGILGLTSHGRRPKLADVYLERALAREMERGASEYKLALLALAACKEMKSFPGFQQKAAT